MSKRLREWRLSRARAARPEKPAASPDLAKKFAEKTLISTRSEKFDGSKP